jgi:hypothetical protein
MNNRSKILTFGLIVLIIFTGVIYAQNQKSAEEPGDKFEITENKEKVETDATADDQTAVEKENGEEDIKVESDVNNTTNNEEMSKQESEQTENKNQENELKSDQQDSTADTADKTAGMIDFEKLIASHPETQEIYKEYQTEKEQIEEGKNKEENLEKLKNTYTYLVIKKTRADLEEFAEKNDLDLLVINDQVVVGEKDKEELPELKDESNQFKEFLNK